jgi:hypothetical protein
LCSFVIESLAGAFENIDYPFPVLKIDSLDGSIHNNVLHVPVNEANDFV